MGFLPLQRRRAADAAESDFAVTEALWSIGSGPGNARRPSAWPGRSASVEESSLPQSIAPDTAPPDSLPPDSLPPDSIPPDSLAAAFDATVVLPRVESTLRERPPASSLAGAAAPSAGALAAGRPTLTHIGRYALEHSLGIGGLGQVHEAWDPLLSRAVAVKTLHLDADAATRTALERLFLAEARAIASLSHRHIVTVHDAGLTPQGVYIAMERLEGSDLRHRLARGWRPGQGSAAQLVRRVADALACAHARGIVHCDIKPANIFVTQRDRPKVLDFGIARVARGRSPPGLESWVAGSPHYLAPEQLRGEPVDARTDVYALGVVFYELLAGRKAFRGESVEQITAAVLGQSPTPLHELRRDVSPTLARIAAKAMARAPAARYASAAQMAGELRRWAERHAHAQARTHARPTAAVARTARPGRAGGARRLRLAWLGITAAVLAAGLFAGWTMQARRTAPLAPMPWRGPLAADAQAGRTGLTAQPLGAR